MLSKIVLIVTCLYLVQASFIEEEGQSNGVTNFAEAVLSRSRRSCGPSECNQHCKRLGHARGVCIGTYCQCRSRLRRSPDEEEVAVAGNDQEQQVNGLITNEEEAYSDGPIADVIKSRSVRSTCGYDSCNRFCRKLGHARGVCIGNYCQCRFRRRRSVPQELISEDNNQKEVQAEENIVMPLVEEKTEVKSGMNFAEAVLSRSRRSCGPSECNQHCRRLGHARGVCIGTYCQCRSR